MGMSTGYTIILYTHMLKMAKLALFSAILAGLLSLTLQYEVSEQNGNSTMITENQAIPWFKVFKRMNAMSVQDCEAACKSQKECTAWTWMDKKNQCRLRKVGFKSISKNLESGIKVESKARRWYVCYRVSMYTYYNYRQNANYNSTMIIEEQALPAFKGFEKGKMSREECVDECGNMDKCAAWTWMEKKKQCRLRGIGFKSTDKKVVSGIKVEIKGRALYICYPL